MAGRTILYAASACCCVPFSGANAMAICYSNGRRQHLAGVRTSTSKDKMYEFRIGWVRTTKAAEAPGTAS